MKYLDPKNDLIFKKVFGEHPDILRSFLNSMLPLAEGQIDMELLEQPEINKAIQYVMEASLTKEEKLLYEKNWDRISSEKTLLTAAEEKGIEKGIIMVARNARKMGMSTNQICEITGLSRE